MGRPKGCSLGAVVPGFLVSSCKAGGGLVVDWWFASRIRCRRVRGRTWNAYRLGHGGRAGKDGVGTQDTLLVLECALFDWAGKWSEKARA